MYAARTSSGEWMRKAKGSCYGGNERKLLSLSSYRHKSIWDMMDTEHLESRRTSFSNCGNEKKGAEKKEKNLHSQNFYCMCCSLSCI